MKRYQTPKFELAVISSMDVITNSLNYSQVAGAGDERGWEDYDKPL